MADAGVTGDFGRLTATIASLRRLAHVPARTAVIAAPRLADQVQTDTRAARNPYAQRYSPHKPATVKRWGRHPLLQLTGAGLESVTGRAVAGAGIRLTAAEHMRFAQVGTKYEVVRAIFPNRPQLPETWNRILKDSAEQAIQQAAKGAA